MRYDRIKKLTLHYTVESIVYFYLLSISAQLELADGILTRYGDVCR